MNILIIKVGALGDVLRTSFIAQALKEKYKEKNPVLFWVTDKKALALFTNNLYVDHLLEIEHKEKLRNVNFDLIINLEEDEENCIFVSSLHCKELLGFIWKDHLVQPTETAQEWFDMSLLGKKPQNDLLKKKNKKTHRQIIAEIVGVDPLRYEPFLKLDEAQKKRAEEFREKNLLLKEDFIIGLNTGAADRWPKSLSLEKTLKLIDLLYKNFKPKILLYGGPNEKERNQKIKELTKIKIIDTGCDNNLTDFISLVSLSTIFITTDSLALHIALALKRKTICLLGPTSPAEIEMYEHGEKIIAKSSCICCYKKNCKSMEHIDLKEVLDTVKKLHQEKITLLITAFKEPNIGKAIEAALNQKTKYPYEVLVSAPDKETLDIAKKYSKDKRLKLMRDPGKGKSFALNLIFKEVETDLLILTDGDVYLSENTVEDITTMFQDQEIGCLSGRPVPFETKEIKYGYWANFLFEAAHMMRKKAYLEKGFLECSGYLFAFRMKKIQQIPLDTTEDSIIPYYFWEKGYTLGYEEKALVFVKNPENWQDWIKQKIRTSKGHETLSKYVNTEKVPRAKTFLNEAKGIKMLFYYPSTSKELFWTVELIAVRFYMWLKVFYDTKILNKQYGDAWERVASAR